MRFIRSWILALRLARRELATRRLSALLAVLFVAIPVAGVTAYLIISGTAEFTPLERYHRALGGGDGRITLTPDGQRSLQEEINASKAELTTVVPADALTLVLEGDSTVRSGSRQAAVTQRSYDTTSPITTPLLVLRSGRLPAAGDEIALSATAAHRLGVGIGDQVEHPRSARSFTITGIQVDRLDTSAAFATFATPAGLGTSVFTAPGGGPAAVVWLVRADPEQLRALASVAPVLDRAGVLARIEPTGSGAALAVFAAALAETAIIVAAAFATVARHQRRQYVLLAVLGGDRRMRLRVAGGLGAAVAMAAIVVGLTGGAAGALLLLPTLQQRAMQDWGPVTVPLAPLVIAVALTGAACVLSANGAARTIARAPLRSPASIGPRRLVTGALAVVGIAGAGITGLLGAVLGSVPLVAASLAVGVIVSGAGVSSLLRLTAPRLGGVPVVLRVALREAAAFPVRPAALASAVCGIVALASCAAFLLTGLLHSDTGYVRQSPTGSTVFTSDQPVSQATLQRAAQQLGAANTGTFRKIIWVSPSSGLPSYLQVDNASYRCIADSSPRDIRTTGRDCTARTGLAVSSPLVAAVARDDLDAFVPEGELARALAAFDGQAAVVLNPRLVGADGQIRMTAGSPGAVDGDGGAAVSADSADAPGQDMPTFTLPGVVVSDDELLSSPMVLLSEQTVARLGLTSNSEVSVLFTRAAPPGTEAEDLARTLLLSDTAQVGELAVERGDPTPGTIARVNQVAAAAIILVSLAVVGAGVALSTGELRDEFAVLSVVGGGAPVRRRVAASQASVLAVTGVAPGLVLGSLGALAFLRIEASPWTWAPALPCAVGAVLLVALAWALGWIATPARQPAPRTTE